VSSRRATKTDLAARVAELETELRKRDAELQDQNRALTESLDQQNATSEILRVISSSPTDGQPIFQAIVESPLG
jgi:hypothetical protein